LAYRRQQATTYFSELYAPMLAIKQTGTDKYLQISNLAAYRSIRHAKLIGSFLEALVAPCSLKSSQRIQRQAVAFHAQPQVI
jgi:hypothetical protein